MSSLETSTSSSVSDSNRVMFVFVVAAEDNVSYAVIVQRGSKGLQHAVAPGISHCESSCSGWAVANSVAWMQGSRPSQNPGKAH